MACVVCHKIYSPNDDNQVDSDEKPHLCTICGLSFTFKIQLKRHMVLHADGAPYTCKYCVNENKGKTYNLRVGNKGEYTCEVCQKSFSNKRMLLRHSIRHTYESEEGFEDAGLEEAIKITIKKRVASPNSKHLSKKTSETKPIKLSLKRHWSHTSPKSKILVCDICNKGFAYQACLDKHIKMGKCSSLSSDNQSPKHVSDDSKLPGNLLPSSSKDLENKNDIGSDSDKTDTKKHVCSICGKTFARKSSLDGHELSHILNKETSEDERYFSDSDDDICLPKKSRLSTFKFQKSFTCDKCNFVCFSKQTLNKHMNNHPEKDMLSSDGVKDEQSKEGGDSFKKNLSSTSKSFKDLEKEIGDISYKCEKCDRKFRNETKLLKHTCPPVKSKKILRCEICNANFSLKRDLKSHLFSHIEGNADVSSLDKKDLFIKHRLKRSKNFACETCGRRFAGEICLRKHQLKHEEETKNNNAETGASPASMPTSGGKKPKPVKEFTETEASPASMPTSGGKKPKPVKEFTETEASPAPMLTQGGKKPRPSEEVTETGTLPALTPTSRGKKPKPVKELICEYCNEEFTGKRAAYVKHIHAHTPEVCGICDERFIDRQSLREHCKIHVGTEEGRMFMQCSQKALDAKNGVPPVEPKVEYIYLVLR